MSETFSERGHDEYEPGSVAFGVYQIESRLGSGGMGVVYKVTHLKLNKVMALKVLPNATASETDKMRLQIEAKTLSRLSHANVASVINFSLEGGSPILTMDFVDGPTLQDVLKNEGRLDLNQFFTIFVQVAAGLDHAHQKEIVHRDLKPANILLATNEDGSIRPVIVDFGVSKLLEMESGFLTSTGSFIGSPLYASPEQADGNASEMSDMYSLGCVMFHALTGQPPFWAHSVMETLLQHKNDPPPFNLIDPTLPAQIVALVKSLLSKNPAQRPLAREVFDKLHNEWEEYSSAKEGTASGTADRISAAKRLSLKERLPDFKMAHLYVLIGFVLVSSLVAVWTYETYFKRPYYDKPIAGNADLSDFLQPTSEELQKLDKAVVTIKPEKKDKKKRESNSKLTELRAGLTDEGSKEKSFTDLFQAGVDEFNKKKYSVSNSLLRSAAKDFDGGLTQTGDKDAAEKMFEALIIGEQFFDHDSEVDRYIESLFALPDLDVDGVYGTLMFASRVKLSEVNRDKQASKLMKKLLFVFESHKGSANNKFDLMQHLALYQLRIPEAKASYDTATRLEKAIRLRLPIDEFRLTEALAVKGYAANTLEDWDNSRKAFHEVIAIYSRSGTLRVNGTYWSSLLSCCTVERKTQNWDLAMQHAHQATIVGQELDNNARQKKEPVPDYYDTACAVVKKLEEIAEKRRLRKKRLSGK